MDTVSHLRSGTGKKGIVEITAEDFRVNKNNRNQVAVFVAGGGVASSFANKITSSFEVVGADIGTKYSADQDESRAVLDKKKKKGYVANASTKMRHRKAVKYAQMEKLLQPKSPVYFSVAGKSYKTEANNLIPTSRSTPTRCFGESELTSSSRTNMASRQVICEMPVIHPTEAGLTDADLNHL